MDGSSTPEVQPVPNNEQNRNDIKKGLVEYMLAIPEGEQVSANHAKEMALADIILKVKLEENLGREPDGPTEADKSSLEGKLADLSTQIEAKSTDETYKNTIARTEADIERWKEAGGGDVLGLLRDVLDEYDAGYDQHKYDDRGK